MQDHDVKVGDTQGQIRQQQLKIDILPQGEYHGSSLPRVGPDGRPLTAGVRQPFLKY